MDVGAYRQGGFDARMDKGKGMARYEAMDVAAWFILRNALDVRSEGEEELGLMRLMKLLYYVEGCSLAVGNGSLFSERIVAWQKGPAVEEIWKYFRKDPMYLQIQKKKLYTCASRLTMEDRHFLENVYCEFGHYTAIGLKEKSCSEMPWQKATDGGRRFGEEILREDIRKYFEENYVTEEDEET